MKPREEKSEASDVDSPVLIEDGQSALINEGEGVELVEAESMVGEENDVTPRPQNADCIGADNSDQPVEAREPEPRAETSTSSADCRNPEDVNSGVDGTSRTSNRFRCSRETVKAAKATKSIQNLGGWLT